MKPMHLFKPVLVLGILLTIWLAIQPSANASVFRTKFNTDSEYLVVEILDDDLAHFEFSAMGSELPNNEPIYTSPMVLKTDYSGPSTLSQNDNVIETSDMKLEIDRTSLCVKLRDKTQQNSDLTTVCPVALAQALKGINIEPSSMKNVYGLGQKFKQLGSADGDWISLGVREGGNDLGNAFDFGFQNAAVGNVQIPVYYAVGSDNLNYALLMDNVYWQKWDFSKSPWQARMYGDQLRFYLMTGKDLPTLRSDFMELTGTPPVPPLKSFGLWVSEFGYDDWQQIDDLKTGLRQNKFPLDGFVLDLNWFGGVLSGKSQMGRLNWDQNQNDSNNYFFPNPEQKIKEYAQDDVRLTAIEESYLANTSDTFQQMPADLTAYSRTNNTCDRNNQSNPKTDIEGFWGKGKMIDWSDSKAGKWFHDNLRFPNLVKKGINVHWTDLGEPETFKIDSCYEGLESTVTGVKNQHPDIHNIYNLLWNKSIWDGYADKQGETDNLGVTNPRPLIMTRSGAAGTQRYGTAMWSGDIASNLKSLATHANAQMQMSFSGIDYYGSDIGGFRREVLPANSQNAPYYTGYEDEMYTQWFAYGSWFDVPVRPHTDNEFGTNRNGCQQNFGKRQPPCYETAPDRIGQVDSNLANIRQRYELLPYYYSLAYRAYLKGEPVMPPPLFYYQNDPKLRQVGNEKMIGKDILVGIVANHGEYDRNIYLPAGNWVNYHSHEWFNSEGQEVENVPIYRDGILRLPTFVRAGAIIPQMYVDEQTKDAFGHRLEGAKRHDELIVNVYANQTPSDFTLYEDDGLTLNYNEKARPLYHYRKTTLKQQQDGNTVTVSIDPAVNQKGNDEVTESFPGAIESRANLVKLIVNDAQATAVSLNGTPLTKYDSQEAFEAANSGWYNAGNNLILAKSNEMDVYKVTKTFSFSLQPLTATTSVNFVCDAGVTVPGQNIYAVGSITALGNWNPANAVKLAPNVYYEYISNPPGAAPGSDARPGPTKPVWTGVIDDLPPNTNFEWKCIRRRSDGSGTVEWQPGTNNKYTTTAAGYAGRSYGTF